jgi:hypothetical protein
MSADPPQDTNGADGSEEPALDGIAGVDDQAVDVKVGRGARKGKARCVCATASAAGSQHDEQTATTA